MEYLDLNELANLMGISLRTAKRRLRQEPWRLPPAIRTPFLPMQRWREVEARQWVKDLGIS